MSTLIGTTSPAISRPQTIAQVITQLDYIIQWSIQRKSRMGYFATLYKLMTEAVQEGIQKGVFENPKRMELLDVIFANRYLDAWLAYTGKKPCTNAWCAAFDACENNSLIVLQHLILGINTHINLDLGIAAAETAPGDSIYSMQNDFERINDIIADLTTQVQEALARVWFPLRFISKITRNREEAVINFSIRKARQASWANAVALAIAKGQGRSNYINVIDNSVVAVAKKVISPGLLINSMLRPVRMMEDRDVANIIRLLQRQQKSHFN